MLLKQDKIAIINNIIKQLDLINNFEDYSLKSLHCGTISGILDVLIIIDENFYRELMQDTVGLIKVQVDDLNKQNINFAKSRLIQFVKKIQDIKIKDQADGIRKLMKDKRFI